MIRKACFLYIMVWAAKNGVMTDSQGFANLAQMRIAGSSRLVTVYITVQGFGRIQINEVMLYEVKDGQIVLEQFFY